MMQLIQVRGKSTETQSLFQNLGCGETVEKVNVNMQANQSYHFPVNVMLPSSLDHLVLITIVQLKIQLHSVSNSVSDNEPVLP